MSQPAALIIGTSDPASGIDCAALVDGLADRARVQRVFKMSAAVEFLRGDSAHCDLIVLCESRRGQFSAEAIDSLRRHAPLARIWRVLGSWHEGEPRSGHPPAGCVSTYWHQWPARATRALESIADSNLPPTATPEERLLTQASDPIEQREGTIAICAGRFESAMALADVCRLAGFDTVMVCDGDEFDAIGARAVIWDTTPERLSDEVAVAQLNRLARGAPIVAVVGFPRVDDILRAKQSGVAAVVSKPYLVRDLLWQLEQAVSSHASTTSATTAPPAARSR